MSVQRSSTLSRALLGLGLLAAALAVLSGYLRAAVFDSERFGANAAAVVQDRAVRTALATAFADRVIELEPQALSARPTLISAGEAALASASAERFVRRSAAETQRALLTADQPSLVLDLADLAIVAGALAAAQGTPLPAGLDPEQLEVAEGISTRNATSDLIRIGRAVQALAWGSTLVAAVALLLALAAAPDRRRGLLELGAGLILVGVAVTSIAWLGREVAIDWAAEHGRAELARAVVDGYGLGLLRWTAALLLAGGLLAASAASLVGDVDVAGAPGRAWRWIITMPERPARRIARGAALVAAGALVLGAPEAALALAAAAGGAYLLVLGLLSVLGAFPSRPDGPAAAAASPAPRFTRTPRGTAAALTAVVALLAVPALAAWQLAGSDPVESAAAPIMGQDRCNGRTDLCGRPLDQVVFASSHNANTTAADGFLNANHGSGMLAQLDAGIRGLLIDALPGERNAQGVVRTDLTGTTREVVVEQIGEEGLAAAQRLGGRVAFGPLGDGAQLDLYLCHVLCELGAVEAVPSLAGIRAWLDRHPRELLIFFVQDDAPQAMVLEAMRASGLAELAAVIDPAQRPLPTLGSLLDSGRQVVLMAENEPGGAPWWLDGFALFQETPFGFPTPQALLAADSCRANRGDAEAPMLLLNHWVETYPPRPRNADRASRTSDIVERAHRCWQERGRVPNLLAVDFVERTGVVEAAAQLNDEVAARQAGGG